MKVADALLVPLLLASLLGPFFARETIAAEPEKTVTNSLGMQLVRIPAGEFLMGSNESKESLKKAFPHYDPKRIETLDDEYPAHKVRITKPFYMGAHEVSIEQFKKYIERSGHKTDAESDGTGGWGYNAKSNAFEGRKLEYSWRSPGFAQQDSHPVVDVTWFDAVRLCDWLSKTEGRKYRLPTEAEWEYACRAGSTTRFNNGDDPDELTKSGAIYDVDTSKVFPEWTPFATKSSDKHQFTAPIGKFKPNAWGLYDMHGNVWEWCSDWHDEKYYANSPAEDPQGPDDGEVKIRRGGSWHTWPFYCRSSFRNWNSRTTRYVLVGIRVVMEVPADR